MEKIVWKGRAIALYILLTALPLGLGLAYAIAYSFGLLGAISKGFTLQYWQQALVSKAFWMSLAYSTYLSAASLVLSCGLGLALAFAIFQRRSSVAKLLPLPLSMPPIIAAFSFFYLLSPAGWLSRLAHHIGFISDLESFPRMVNDWAGIGVLATHTFLLTPFMALYFLQLAQQHALAKVREAAYTLGSSTWQFAKRIFVPMLLKQAKPTLLLYAIFLLGAYEVPLLLGRQAPQAISVLIAEKTGKFDLQHIPVGYAMAVAYTLLVGTMAFTLRTASTSVNNRT